MSTVILPPEYTFSHEDSVEVWPCHSSVAVPSHLACVSVSGVYFLAFWRSMLPS